MSLPPLPGPFWLVGCGNMAGAMLARWLDCRIDRSLVTVIRPSGREVAGGVRVVTSYPESEAPALVMLGTKPQKLDEVAPILEPYIGPETVLISILAGTELQSLRARFPRARAILKTMPNLPVSLGKGVLNLFTDSRDAEARALVETLMQALGRTEWFEEEAQLQAAGILTGAGPAFLFRFIDALAEAAEAIGVPREKAARLAEAMVEGAAMLAAFEAESPARLAERVASPGGTTQAGLKVLDEEEALKRLVQGTLEAGLRRSRELAEAARAAS
ncbi:MAG TPA: pyrroline-5-carboxylate reductase [Allosphingosinicella sp.]|nr:pyrroline-5-carboxylate reductase [Allosphingosinicella sp.]